MIAVLCLNPSFDRTVEVQEMKLGQTNRIVSSMLQAGGKGLNVATCLRTIGLDSLCIGCAGEENYEQFRKLLGNRSAWTDFELIPGFIRQNTKIVSVSKNPCVTELNEQGPVMPKNILQKVRGRFRKAGQQSLMSVITGSLPPGCPDGTYRDFLEDSDVPCVLDVGGKELIMGLSSHPFLVKPNLEELENAVGRELHEMNDICAAGKYLCECGAAFTVVSMGKNGAVITDGTRVLFSPSLHVPVGSTVGAGDAMVSGLIAGYLKERNMESMLRFGTAAAAASVMTSGTGLFEYETFCSLLERAETRGI